MFHTRLHDYIQDVDTYLDLALLAVNGNYLWAGDRNAQEVAVYDLGSPDQPVEIGRFAAPDPDLTIRAVHDGNIMICLSQNQLWAVAIGDNVLHTLSLIDALGASPVRQYEFHAGWLFILDYDGLQIWDYTTPTDPDHLGTIPCDLAPTHFVVDGGTIVVGDSEGFQVLMGGPGAMLQAVSPVIEHPHRSLTVADSYLYVADDDGNLILYDLVIPAVPEIVGVAHGPSTERPYVDGDRIYAGYSVFPLPCGDSSPIDDPGRGSAGCRTQPVQSPHDPGVRSCEC